MLLAIFVATHSPSCSHFICNFHKFIWQSISTQLTQHNHNQESDSHASDFTNQSQPQRCCSICASSDVVATKKATLTHPVTQKRKVEAFSASELERLSVQGIRNKKTRKQGDPSKGAIEGDFDYNQDTDNGSVTILLRLTGQAKVVLYDDPKNYFEESVCNQLDDPKNPLSFQCKWCPVIYRGHKTLLGNLQCHRDGFTQAGKSNKQCVNRHKAKPVTLTFERSLFYMLSQTTDSGSNNNTIASKMYELLHKTPDGHAQSTMWDPA
ncbi:hypothetical protein MJO28_006213, partial [Puccinia striiformis f. sp. tritici]